MPDYRRCASPLHSYSPYLTLPPAVSDLPETRFVREMTDACLPCYLETNHRPGAHEIRFYL